MSYHSELRCRYEYYAPYGRHTCVYCGDSAPSLDHVPPVSSLYMMIGSVPESKLPKCYTVPACMECNSILGAVGKFTVHARAMELKSRLKKRYKKILSLPSWSEEELSQLSDALREHVMLGIAKRESLKLRLSFQLPANPKA